MKTLKTTLIAFMAVTIISCVSLYDPFTFDQTKLIKTETLSLMDKSDTPFTDSQDEVTNLKTKMASMVTYESGKKNNEITIKMWKVLSSDKNLVGSYLKLWEEKGSLNTVFKDEAKPQIEEAFDKMLFFEKSKDKENENALKEFLDQFNL